VPFDDQEQSVVVHRYNSARYSLEDLRGNQNYSVVRLRGGDNISFVGKRRARRVSSTGFLSVLLASALCKKVACHGLDLSGRHPGHYFNDATEGLVRDMRLLIRRDPWRTTVAPNSIRADVNLADDRATVRDVIARYSKNLEKGNHNLVLERSLLSARARSGQLLLLTPDAG
jgi:hypothetical protein